MRQLFEWFGKNKSAAMVCGGCLFFCSFALVIGGQLTGPEWLSSMTVFVPIWVGLVVGPSAVLKTKIAHPPQGHTDG